MKATGHNAHKGIISRAHFTATARHRGRSIEKPILPGSSVAISTRLSGRREVSRESSKMEIPTNIEEVKEKIVKKSKGTASREVVHRPSRTRGVNII